MATLSAREIHDRDEWNALVVSLPSYDLRQGWEWGALRASQRWRPRRLAVFDGPECVAAAAVLGRRLPGVPWSVLYVPGGPLLADVKRAGAWTALLAALRDLAGETRAAFLRVDPKVPEVDVGFREALTARGFQPLPHDWTTWNIARIVMITDLLGSEDDIKRRLRKRHREYIASAPKRGVTVRPAASLAEARRFRVALAEVGREKGLPVRGAEYFEEFWRHYVAQGRGVLLLAEHQGATVGGLLGARLGRRAEMLQVNVRESVGGERLHHGPLLYWEFIRWARQADCELVDWGGTGTHFPPREDDAGFGVYHFKLGFDARLEYLTGYYDLPFRRRPYAAARWLETSGAGIAWRARARLNTPWSFARGVVAGTRRLGGASAARLATTPRPPSALPRPGIVAPRLLQSAAAAVRTVLWPVLRVQRVTFYESDLTAPFERPVARVPLEIRVATPGDFEVYGAVFARLGLERAEAQRRLDRGDVAVLAFTGPHLAHMQWMAFSSLWLDLGLTLHLEPGEAYAYNAVTAPEWRGFGIHPAVSGFINEWERAHGYTRHVSYVRSDNVQSIRVTASKLRRRPTRTLWSVWILGMRRPAILGLRGRGRPRLETSCPGSGR